MKARECVTRQTDILERSDNITTNNHKLHFLEVKVN